MAAAGKIGFLFVLVLIASGMTVLLFYFRTQLTRNRGSKAMTRALLGAGSNSANIGRLGPSPLGFQLRTLVFMRAPGSNENNRSTNSSAPTNNAKLLNITTANVSEIHPPTPLVLKTGNLSSQTAAFSNASTRLDSSSSKANDDSVHSSDKFKTLITSDPSKPIICHYFSPGRLGNHLFEYASILGIAHKTNRSFYFPNDGLLLKDLKYPPIQNRSEGLKARCKASTRKTERYLCRYDNLLLQLEEGQDYTLDTYFQSWVYFDGLQEEIRHAVTFSDEIVKNASLVISRLRKEHPETVFVGIHNRRGDLVKTAKLTRMGYKTASAQFFQKAMSYFRLRFSRVLFLVLGEDKQWSAQNILSVDNDVVFLEPTSSPAVDMQILSLTDHMIRTVGTYGWWAAFKIPGKASVVYLKDFVKKGSPLSLSYSANAEDYMLPHWIAM